MNENKFMSLILGIFVLFLFLVYGVFSDIMKAFTGSFGLGYGLLLGGLFCLIIILSLFGGNKRK
jgi:hypothetical protein